MYVDPTFIRHAARTLALVGITMLFGCQPSSQHETEEANETRASSLKVKVYDVVKVLAVIANSAEGYQAIQEGQECWAHEDSMLTVVRSRGDYLLLRYSPTDRKQWVENIWPECPPGTLVAMSEDDFERFERHYENKLEKLKKEKELREAAKRLVEETRDED